MNTVRAHAMVWMIALLLGATSAISAQEYQPYTDEDLDRLLAPIALYPDALLSQVLIASTYPIEVVEAARWVRRNPHLRGGELEWAVEDKPWDPSIKALVAFPQVLDMMSEELDWTQSMGDAFVGQQPDVMEAIQRLRHRARRAGYLVSSPRQTVVVEREVILIEPAEPDVVYVPVYDPTLVYGTWWRGAPPYSVYPRAYVARSPLIDGLYFGLGVALTRGLWSGFDWHDHYVYVHRHRPVTRRFHDDRGFSGDHIRDARPAVTRWRHDPRHRHGVVYHEPRVRERFEGVRRGSSGDGRKGVHSTETRLRTLPEGDQRLMPGGERRSSRVGPPGDVRGEPRGTKFGAGQPSRSARETQVPGRLPGSVERPRPGGEALPGLRSRTPGDHGATPPRAPSRESSAARERGTPSAPSQRSTNRDQRHLSTEREPERGRPQVIPAQPRRSPQSSTSPTSRRQGGSGPSQPPQATREQARPQVERQAPRRVESPPPARREATRQPSGTRTTRSTASAGDSGSNSDRRSVAPSATRGDRSQDARREGRRRSGDQEQAPRGR